MHLFPYIYPTFTTLTNTPHVVYSTTPPTPEFKQLLVCPVFVSKINQKEYGVYVPLAPNGDMDLFDTLCEIKLPLDKPVDFKSLNEDLIDGIISTKTILGSSRRFTAESKFILDNSLVASHSEHRDVLLVIIKTDNTLQMLRGGVPGFFALRRQSDLNSNNIDLLLKFLNREKTEFCTDGLYGGELRYLSNVT